MGKTFKASGSRPNNLISHKSTKFVPNHLRSFGNTALQQPPEPSIEETPFFPPKLRLPEFDVDLVTADNGYLITKQVTKESPYADNTTPTLFFDMEIIQELRYIARRMSKITGESGFYMTIKKVSANRPHFLVYDYFLVKQEASAGEVSLDGEDAARYWNYLRETYPKEFGNNPHTKIAHGHVHPPGVYNFSSIDMKQQNGSEGEEGLGFMGDYRPYVVMLPDGTMKASFVQYYPVFRRIEDCNLGIRLTPGEVFPILGKERKAEMDNIMDALISKRTYGNRFGGFTPAVNHPFGTSYNNPFVNTLNNQRQAQGADLTKAYDSRQSMNFAIQAQNQGPIFDMMTDEVYELDPSMLVGQTSDDTASKAHDHEEFMSKALVDSCHITTALLDRRGEEEYTRTLNLVVTTLAEEAHQELLAEGEVIEDYKVHAESHGAVTLKALGANGREAAILCSAVPGKHLYTSLGKAGNIEEAPTIAQAVIDLTEEIMDFQPLPIGDTFMEYTTRVQKTIGDMEMGCVDTVTMLTYEIILADHFPGDADTTVMLDHFRELLDEYSIG